MAIAKFHSPRGEKSALILVKANQFIFGWTPVYVPRAPFEDSEGNILEKYSQEDHTFQIPDGFKLVPIVDENGEVRTTKDGVELKQLAY